MSDYISQSRGIAQKESGLDEEAVDQHLVAGFHLYSASHRSRVLQTIADQADKNEIDEVDIRREMERADLVRQLTDVHEKLRRAGR